MNRLAAWVVDWRQLCLTGTKTAGFHVLWLIHEVYDLTYGPLI